MQDILGYDPEKNDVPLYVVIAALVAYVLYTQVPAVQSAFQGVKDSVEQVWE